MRWTLCPLSLTCNELWYQSSSVKCAFYERAIAFLPTASRAVFLSSSQACPISQLMPISICLLCLLMPANLAECFESDHLIPATLNHALGCRANEIHPAFLQLLLLRAHADRSTTVRADYDTWTAKSLKCYLRSCFLQYRSHNTELLDRRIVQQTLAPTAIRRRIECCIGIVDWLQKLLLRWLVVIRQDLRQGVNILELGRKSRTDHVVAARHTLNNIARDVGMDVVCFEIHCLARRELDEVEKEEHEEPDIGGKLRVAALDDLTEFRGRVDRRARSDLLVRGEGEEVFGLDLHGIRGLPHE